MGVKFRDIISPDSIKFEQLESKIVALDAANVIYQFLSSIRQVDGTPLMDQNGNITSHFSGILYRTSSLIEKGIKPVYIFDGTSDILKKGTQDKRREVKEESQKKMEKALEEGYALNLNFPPLLNLLAHHYALSNKKLSVAEKLVHIALEHNSNNPHYLDTQALLFYKKKEYPKALALLEKIAQQEPRDFGILKTLGKTHYKVGNFKQAIHAIEQAMTVATHEQDKEQCTLLLKEWTKPS